MEKVFESLVLKFILAFVLLIIISPIQAVNAEASVGFGTGKIETAIPIEPGSSTVLDTLAVYNDRDCSGIFEMEVMFNETQDELKPGSACHCRTGIAGQEVSQCRSKTEENRRKTQKEKEKVRRVKNY